MPWMWARHVFAAPRGNSQSRGALLLPWVSRFTAPPVVGLLPHIWVHRPAETITCRDGRDFRHNIASHLDTPPVTLRTYKIDGAWRSCRLTPGPSMSGHEITRVFLFFFTVKLFHSVPPAPEPGPPHVQSPYVPARFARTHQPPPLHLSYP